METPLIEFNQVTKRFDTRTVLDGLSMKIYEGDVTTIIGKSGVGKSVLLKHIIGLLDADDGEVLVHGRPIHKLSSKEKSELLGRISYMFQNNALFDALSVYDNIALPLRYTTRLSRAEIDAKVKQRIRQTELEDVPDRFPSELSGGMRKRVALARALITDPEIVLFDEPTTGQDPIRRNAILSMIAEYQRKLGFTAVLISHDLPDVFFISNRIIAIYKGKAIFQGSPEAFDDFKHPFREEFTHSLEVLQEELTGLYSRRHFKVRYQTELMDTAQAQDYAVVLFTLNHLSEVQKKLGHTAAQELIRAIGALVSQYFNDVGGFSTRYGVHQYTTVLPQSNGEEAAGLVSGFARTFEKEGVVHLKKLVKSEFSCADAVSVSVSAGIAHGQPHADIESIIEDAGSRKEEILTFSATCKGQ